MDQVEKKNTETISNYAKTLYFIDSSLVLNELCMKNWCVFRQITYTLLTYNY